MVSGAPFDVAAAPAVHEAVVRPLAALDAAGVRWCVLRGIHELDRVDGDVDLLVGHSDVERLRQALTSSGAFIPQISWGRRPHLFFLGPATADGTRIKLDVVTRLAFGRFGELPTDAAGAVLARRQRVGPVWAPAPGDAFWALLLHAVLDHGHLRVPRADELQALVGEARGAASPLRDVFERACPPSWNAGRALETVAAGARGELSKLGPQLHDRWPGTTRMSRGTTVVARRLLRRAQRAQQRGSIASKRRARSTG